MCLSHSVVIIRETSVRFHSAWFFCVGRCGQGGGGSPGGRAERRSVAEDGRVQPRKAAAQTGWLDGEGPAPAGGGLSLRAFFMPHALGYSRFTVFCRQALWNNVTYRNWAHKRSTIHFHLVWFKYQDGCCLVSSLGLWWTYTVQELQMNFKMEF